MAKVNATVAAVVLVVALLLVGVYDYVAFLQAGEGATVTQVLRGWSASYPILPFCAGLVAGHLFW